MVMPCLTGSMARMNGAGAAMYPTRNPVMEKHLEKPLIVMVRSHKPAMAAMLWWRWSSYTNFS